jgi:hypothetical protein
LAFGEDIKNYFSLVSNRFSRCHARSRKMAIPRCRVFASYVNSLSEAETARVGMSMYKDRGMI